MRPGHICDPDTGRCVCPSLTYGEHCDRCRPGSWNLIPGIGCKPCACTLGSMRSQCDHRGQCVCRIGYDGLRCERCAKGYYGYPRCRPCGCNAAGILSCDGEICDCDENGQCPCKVHFHIEIFYRNNYTIIKSNEVEKKFIIILSRIRYDFFHICV